MPLLEDLERLVAEGGEGGESATESRSKQQTHISCQRETAAQRVEQPYQETTQHIGREGAPRK